MPNSSTLGGPGSQFPSVADYQDFTLDFGTANNGGAANLQSGGLGNVNSLTDPFGRFLSGTGTAASSGVNINALVDDGNGRVAISLGGGVLSGGSVNGGSFGFNLPGITLQLIKPTAAGPVSLYPAQQQAWLIDWWLQWGPLGGSPNRGDCGVSFEMGNGTVPDVNCIHNINTGGAPQTGAALGMGLFLFADGNLHFFSNPLGTGNAAGANDILATPPVDIARVSFVFYNATLTQNAQLAVYLNRVLLKTYVWTLGAGHVLPLWTDTGGANHASFQPQVIATPPGQDTQAFKSSGLLCYGFRWRRGPAAQILANFFTT